jgi:hypothetical protein
MTDVLSIRDLLDKKFGLQVITRENRLVSQVDTTVVQIARADPTRIGLYIVNLDSVNLYAGWFENVSTTRGVVIGPGGGNLYVFYDEDGDLPARAWFALADAAATDLLVTEYLIRKTGPRGANA